MRAVSAAMGEAHFGQQLAEARLGFSVGEEGRQLEVFRDGQRREQTEVLEHKAELLAAQARSLLLGQFLDRFAQQTKRA